MNPQPKPRSHVLERADRKRQRKWDELALRRFIRARDKHHCQCCGHSVMPTAVDPAKRAEVHHLVFRSRSKAAQMDPARQVLLCAICHRGIHAGEITAAGTSAATVTFRRVR